MTWDVLRVVIIVLFGLCLGETAYIVKQYLGIIKSTRRLLPMHVISVGFAFLGLEAVAVWQNIVRLHTGFSGYIVVNLPLFALAYTSLLMMRIHITRKKRAHDKISGLLNDPHMMP